MLKAEEIASRLQAAKKLKPWVDERMERLADLDPSMRTIGHFLLGCNREGKRVADNHVWSRHSKGEEKLRSLNSDEMLRLGQALLPRFPEVFTAAWELFDRLPFQAGYGRKPFRAPGRPEPQSNARRGFLSTLLAVLEGYDESLPWVAAHAPHISPYLGAQELGILLAAAIDLGGDRGREVEDVLRESASGQHEIGQMGRHLTTAFLCSGKPDCWEFVEKLLLAAQRQEGLRQVILESIDFSHPEAFRRMLRVIDDNNLVRFSATVRAVDVWMGLQLDSASAGYVVETLHNTATYLDDTDARAAALAGDDPEKAFLALWSSAFDDAPATIPQAEALLSYKKAEMRFIGVHMLSMIGLPATYEPTLPAVDDEDDRVAVYAAGIVGAELQRRYQAKRNEKWQKTGEHDELTPPPAGSGDLFERLESLYGRLPEKPKPQKPLVWPWMVVDVRRQAAADWMVLALGDRPASKMLPYLDSMSPGARTESAKLLGRLAEMDAEARSTLVRLVGDPASGVREAAVKAMKAVTISADDLSGLEPLLDRKRSDLRRSVLTLILSLKDGDVLASAERLTGSKALPKRLAGLDLLQQLHKEKRSVRKVGELAEAYREAHKTLNRDEKVYLENLSQSDQLALTLADAVGLMDPNGRTPPPVLKDRGTKLVTPAAIALIQQFDALIHKNREMVITFKPLYGDVNSQALGTVTYAFPSPLENDRGKVKLKSLDDLPLRELWFEAWESRPKSARDRDGLEAARALLALSMWKNRSAAKRSIWRGELMDRLADKLPKPKYPGILDDVLGWLTIYKGEGELADFVVDGFETLLTSIPTDKLAEKPSSSSYSSQEHTFRELIDEFVALHHYLPNVAELTGKWTLEHAQRLFGLKRWVDEPVIESPSKDQPTKIARSRMDWKKLTDAFDHGWANEHDIFDHLFGNQPKNRYVGWPFGSIRDATSALRRGELSEKVAPLIKRAMERILEIELARGEMETVVTPATMSMRYAGGIDVLVRVLQAIGHDPKLQRNVSWWGSGGQGKSAVFSHLIRSTTPDKADTPESFAKAVKAGGIDENALIALAFYAPQWAKYVQKAVGWPMFEEAVWWFHAHTKESTWSVDSDIREGWNAEIRKLTPLTLEDLTEGAVDVDWFHRTYKAIGPKRWTRLDEFAKYASSSGGHKRAQLFANAMLGKLKKADLTKDIADKRKQDALRALGLLPLEKKTTKNDVLARYKIMQEFVRTSRQFGSQRQASEKLAARIGQENLARTAGYPDPIRLQWAMEGLATADLAAGPVVVHVKDVAVSLSIDAEGLPDVAVKRAEKPLKSIPPDVKKNEQVAELLERKTDLKRSSSRMRLSLEQAMCRGDEFSGESLVELMGNAILRPMLERLIFLGDGIAGYPVSGGKGLRNAKGKVEPVKKSESLRLAHPVDFLASKHWKDWQHDCFTSERVQPFKQIFREMYVLTSQERSDATFSRRYAGQQVNPRQALALLGSRGWVTAPEAGVFRTFHDEKLVAWIEFMEAFYTPAEVEGLTLEKIRFARRGADEVLKPSDVPARLLSEVLRDVDLIVSVAHRGAVDPEASASTVELRSSLLRETLSLLKLDNVKIKEPHVFIRGTLGEYTVHLGSATTQIMAGGSLFIVPVHSQHRGRLFLPFADDDPKTAEILSKVLLLARDREIQDPNLLDQIRSIR